MRLLCGILLFASLATAATPILFDTDIGDDIDDALALGLALQSPELDVRAVTTVIDDTESRTRLAWKELGLYGRHDVALATGASEPLLDPARPFRARQFEVLTAADTVPEEAHRRAADLIIETLLRADRKMTIVPVGPLTNIALALKTEPRIKAKIERIVLMGGAFELLRPEYNIRRDRAAAQIVFSSGVPITAVGLDVTTKCKLQGADLDRLRTANNPASQFLYRLIQLWQNGHADQYPTLHDPLAVAVAMFPDLIETSTGHVTVETNSPLTDGITMFRPATDGNVKVARNVDVQRFLKLFVDRLSAPPRPRAKVEIQRLPEGGMQPQVAVDTKGVVHAVYLKGEPGAADIFYMRREGDAWSTPIRVNSVPGSAVASGTVRGAQLALGRKGRAHVIWFGSHKNELGNPVEYARLNDAGTAFEPERDLMHAHGGLDGGPTITADDNGNVYAAWHGKGDTPGEPNRRVWLVRSHDDGATFTPEAAAIDARTGACACCSMRLFATDDGDLYLLYRTATESIHRDMYLAVSKDGGSHFSGERIHPWQINACPMTTSMFSENGHRIVSAWETEKQVFFSDVQPGSSRIRGAVAAPGSGARKHPAIALNSAGESLLVWDEGTGFRKGGSIAWQLFDSHDRAMAESGRAAGEPAFSLPAVYARPDGGFTVLY
jgi:inosine-uridine nucleoside N-ribohydrolase